MVAINGRIFISTTSCFTQGALKSGMFWEVESKVESKVKMAGRCCLGVGGWRGGQAAGVDEAGPEIVRWRWRDGEQGSF